MEKTITKSDVLTFIKKGEKLIGKLALESYGDSINRVVEQAFSEAIEIGIENTIAALCDAKVDDKEILRVVCEHWGLSLQNAEDRLIYEKQQATINSLKQYLRLQGYSKTEIEEFIKNNKATMQIRHNKDLLKYKNNPEKLMKTIQSNNK